MKHKRLSAETDPVRYLTSILRHWRLSGHTCIDRPLLQWEQRIIKNDLLKAYRDLPAMHRRYAFRVSSSHLH